MNSLKSVLSFLLLFGFFALPVLFVYKAPKSYTVKTRKTALRRLSLSARMPATQSCETIKKVRWKCKPFKEGEPECVRDGFDEVKYCQSLMYKER